jgi:lipopolysaccharide/colanic/teichoic acid biosynthesis glycosyltransferase
MTSLLDYGVDMQTDERPVNALPMQQPSKGGLYRRYIKRSMDIIVSLCAIIVLSPLLLIVAVLVRVMLGSPVIFKQRRPGLNEKVFVLYKYRTMTDECDINGVLLPDNIRLTRFGRFLRSTSLDELLELYNILLGDMSIIGPRPLLIQYLPLYNDQQKRRHEVRSGLSGLAQVNGRNSISWEDKFKMDVQYVDSVSFILDCEIFMRTIVKVLKHEGINTNGGATMDKFSGTAEVTNISNSLNINNNI